MLWWYPQHLVHQYSFKCAPWWREALWESITVVPGPRTQHNVPGQGSNQDCSIQRKVHIAPLEQKCLLASIFFTYQRTDFHVCFCHRLGWEEFICTAEGKKTITVQCTFKMFYRGIEELLDLVRSENAGVQQCHIPLTVIIGHLFLYNLPYSHDTCLDGSSWTAFRPLEHRCHHLTLRCVSFLTKNNSGTWLSMVLGVQLVLIIINNYSPKWR